MIWSRVKSSNSNFMAEVLNQIRPLRRNSLKTMFVIVVVFFVASQAGAQDHAMSTESPSHSPSIPFLDLFTGASTYYGDTIRKTYDPYAVSCPKPDTLSTFANVLGSAAKIMLSAAVIVFLKILAGKLLLAPLLFVFVAKLGLKAFLLWPMISKLMKYFKKKKKKGHKGRMITDCSQRIACVIQRASKGWGSNLGAAVTFSMIDDVDEDTSYAKAMLSILSGDKVAECMSLDCSSGIDIS